MNNQDDQLLASPPPPAELFEESGSESTPRIAFSTQYSSELVVIDDTFVHVRIDGKKKYWPYIWMFPCLTLLVLVLCLVAVLNAFIFNAPKCSDGYVYFNKTGFCYKVSPLDEELTFEYATLACESENANLASIHSPAENDFLSRLYHTTFGEHVQNVDVLKERSRIWLGLVYSNNTWQWTDGTNVNYLKWGTNEPNKMDREYWTQMTVSRNKAWSPDGNEWNNINDKQSLQYFCKKPAGNQ